MQHIFKLIITVVTDQETIKKTDKWNFDYQWLVLHKILNISLKLKGSGAIIGWWCTHCQHPFMFNTCISELA